MKSFQVLNLIAMLSVLAACSAGGSRQVPGRQCAANYAPLGTESTDFPTKTWKKGENESLPPGTYTYEGSELIYSEKIQDGLIVHVIESRDRAGAMKSGINCVRNAKGLERITAPVSGEVANKIVAAPGTPSKVGMKTLTFKMVEGRLASETKDLGGADKTLTDAYGASKFTNVVMIANPNGVDYEIRSFYEENGAKFASVVRLKRAP